MNHVNATALVRVTIEIASCGGAWGPDCTVDQVHKQAKREALEFLEGMPPGRVRIVGEPRVLMVTTETDR